MSCKHCLWNGFSHDASVIQRGHITVDVIKLSVAQVHNNFCVHVAYKKQGIVFTKEYSRSQNQELSAAEPIDCTCNSQISYLSSADTMKLNKQTSSLKQ